VPLGISGKVWQTSVAHSRVYALLASVRPSGARSPIGNGDAQPGVDRGDLDRQQASDADEQPPPNRPKSPSTALHRFRRVAARFGQRKTAGKARSSVFPARTGPPGERCDGPRTPMRQSPEEQIADLRAALAAANHRLAEETAARERAHTDAPPTRDLRERWLEAAGRGRSHQRNSLLRAGRDYEPAR
jgi:hypothetical protein